LAAVDEKRQAGHQGVCCELASRWLKVLDVSLAADGELSPPMWVSRRWAAVDGEDTRPLCEVAAATEATPPELAELVATVWRARGHDASTMEVPDPRGAAPHPTIRYLVRLTIGAGSRLWDPLFGCWASGELALAAGHSGPAEVMRRTCRL
jgi:hypothetical protein